MIIDQPERNLKPFSENEACFMFVNKGDFSVRTPEQLHSLQAGQGLLAKCFNFFVETTELQRKNTNSLELIGVYLYPLIIEELIEVDLSTSNHIVDYNAKKMQVDGLLNHFKDGINLLLENPELADEAIIRTKLKEFILLISKRENARSHLDFLSGLFRVNTTEFTTTIGNNLYSNLSVDEFAVLCGMSLSSFKRKFTEVYKESPKKYIARKKIEKATDLLKASELRISDVAYDVGFETISTFNRTFRSVVGKSPTEYRLN
ncbi:MAG: helix-turn-helix transcriptional regulator [Flavobacteriales bacterium]|nr:helix-turn-helix transcriptional regulator [Flavobacteriales bacterium]